MENTAKKAGQAPVIELSRKEKALEFVANAMCFLLLLAFFLKVLFF